MAATASGWSDYPYLQPNLTLSDGTPRNYLAEADVNGLSVRYARKVSDQSICEVGIRNADPTAPGFRTRATVEHACYRLLALGVTPRIEGDLSKDGGLDEEARRTLSEVNSGLKFKDPWRRGARPLADIGVLHPGLCGASTDTIAGVTQILEEGGHQFDVLDLNMDFSPYRALIGPDVSHSDERWSAKVKACLSDGGAVLTGCANTDYASARPDTGTDKRSVALLENHFESYARYATPLHKRAVLDSIAKLLPEPLLRHDGPSTLFTSVLEQKELNRWVIHLIYYQPQRRAAGIDVIDSYIPLHEVKFSLRAPGPIRQISLRPQHHDTLDFWEKSGRTEFVVRKMAGHQIVSVEFAQ